MFKIEKNVPLLSVKGFSKTREIYGTLMIMEIKDSFLCTVKEYRIFGTLKKTKDLNGKIFSARRDGENYRIFRVV